LPAIIDSDRDPTERQFADDESADNIDNIDNKFRKQKQKQIVVDQQDVIGAK
jgi:hypothetical protein